MTLVEFLGGDILANSPLERTLQEIHILAYMYHWGREECWNLPCTERGMWVDKIKAQVKAETNGGNDSGGTPQSSYKEAR